MIENTNMNIPSVTVDTVIELLSRLYTDAVKNGLSMKQIPTPMLWGPAGVGKSEAVVQLSHILAETSGKKTTVTDVRLLLFSPVDLRGVPVADENKKFTSWLMPRIFDMNTDDSYINILFLDELSAAPQSVQAAAYQICLDRRVGEHKLPDNCIVIAAGNRTTDQSVAFKMPKALCNRTMHFNVETNYKSWCKWAASNGIDERIIGYLGFDNSKLCVEPSTSEMAYPTPRSWTFVSNIIKNSTGSLDDVHLLIGACVGVDTAIEFETWAASNRDLPSVEQILSGRTSRYPSSYDALVALTSSLVCVIRSLKDKITQQELENVCAYVLKFPKDFAMTFYNDLNSVEEIRLKLMRCPSCQKWFSKNRQNV